MSVPASNKLYFKSFNDDFRVGGVYYPLDNSELCTLIILHSYSDGWGRVLKTNGAGYNYKELSDMVRMNYRATKKALVHLEDKGFIEVGEDMVILIVSFLSDQTERDTSNSAEKVLARTLAIAKRKLENQAKDSESAATRLALNDLHALLRSMRDRPDLPVRCPYCDIQGLQDTTDLARHIIKTQTGNHITVLAWAANYLNIDIKTEVFTGAIPRDGKLYPSLEEAADAASQDITKGDTDGI